MTSNESLFFLYTIIWEIIEQIQYVEYKVFWLFFSNFLYNQRDIFLVKILHAS